MKVSDDMSKANSGNLINIRTPYCRNICDCVDWSDHNEWTGHLNQNVLTGVTPVLTYDSLETFNSASAILCLLCKCEKCGKQICFGQTLENISSFDDFMSTLVAELSSLDRVFKIDVEKTVVSLFHEEDCELALDWLFNKRQLQY